MLTCKVGETIINCFDGTYDKYTLKQWSDKGILKCPVCNGEYEYCHGEYILPYFRHKEKQCDGYYYEPETDEHMNGKIKLYNWIKQQDGVTNCKLEAWIPETKQRPDIYFEYKNKKYVIEFQCTPIATEYKKRHELYKLNNINDIWILGTDKYNIEIWLYYKWVIDNKEIPIKYSALHYGRYKTIEKEQNFNGLIYFDVKNNVFVFHKDVIEKRFNKKFIYDFYVYMLKDVSFKHNQIFINNEIGSNEICMNEWFIKKTVSKN